MHFNCIPTIVNLALRHIIDIYDQSCSADCRYIEDRDHLFVKCDFYGRIWSLVVSWLGFSTAPHKFLHDHLVQFGGLRGYSKNVRLSLNIISLYVVWTIWMKKNIRFFRHKEYHLLSLSEKVKLHSFWWLKLRLVTFKFHYLFWRINLISFLSVVN